MKKVIFGTVPSKSNSYAIAHKRIYKTKPLKDYERSFSLQIGELANKALDCFFDFEVDVYYPSMRADLDNSLKIILDCLQQTNTIANDNKCLSVLARRFKDKENPRIEFKITVRSL